MSFAVASTASLRAPVAFRGKAAARRPARVAVRPPAPSTESHPSHRAINPPVVTWRRRTSSTLTPPRTPAPHPRRAGIRAPEPAPAAVRRRDRIAGALRRRRPHRLRRDRPRHRPHPRRIARQRNLPPGRGSHQAHLRRRVRGHDQRQGALHHAHGAPVPRHRRRRRRATGGWFPGGGGLHRQKRARPNLRQLAGEGKPNDVRITGLGQGETNVIPGLDEGILTMRSGGVRHLYIPGDLAFPKGLASAPGRPRISPFSPVVFDVKLLYIPGLE